MTGIFDNFDKLEMEEMRFEVALFEAISVSNYANEVKTFAQNRGTKLINTVSGLVNAKGINEVKVETVEELVSQKCGDLKYAVKEELHEEMVNAVRERLLALGIAQADLKTEEQIAFYAVQEAEKSITGGVGADASMAQKADDIASLFNKKQIKELKGNISQNKQDRDLLAHFVWKVSVHNRPYFPVSLEERPEEADFDRELWNLLSSKPDYAQKEKDLLVSITSTEYKIAGAKSCIADLESKLGYVDIRIAEYKEKGEEESADAQSAIRVKEITESEINGKRTELVKQEEKLKALNADKICLASEKQQKELQEEELVKKLTAVIKEKWTDRFLGVVVSEEAIEHLVSIYSLKDRKVLESAIIELGSCTNPSLYCQKTGAGNDFVFSFVVSKTAVGRITFSDENGVLEISKILKVRRTF